MMYQTMTKFFSCVLCLFALNGCVNVEPWERDILAKPEMAYEPRGNERAFREHMYFSREGTSEGYGAAGGGCGCN